MMDNINYSAYPWSKLGERRNAALKFQYYQSAHAFNQHLDECEKCTSNGLCIIGSQYNKICSDLEEEQEKLERVDNMMRE